MKWNIKNLIEDYAPPEGDDLLFTEEDQDLLTIKEIVSKLEPYDRIILLMYAELGSLRLVAKELNVSHTAAIKKMDQIKMEVLGKFYEMKAESLNNKIKRKIKNDDIT